MYSCFYYYYTVRKEVRLNEKALKVYGVWVKMIPKSLKSDNTRDYPLFVVTGIETNLGVEGETD